VPKSAKKWGSWKVAKSCQKLLKVWGGKKVEKKSKKRGTFLPYQRLINCQGGKTAHFFTFLRYIWGLKTGTFSRSALLHGRFFFWQLLKTHFFWLFYKIFENWPLFFDNFLATFDTFLKNLKNSRNFVNFFSNFFRSFFVFLTIF
jgi:hypothetical protein